MDTVNTAAVNYHGSAYAWSIELEAQTLTCDDRLKELLFGENLPDLKAQTLFELVPFLQRKMIRDVFKLVLDTGQAKSIHCCLLAKSSLLTYVAIDIERKSKSELHGYLYPCFSIADRQQAAELVCSIFDNEHHGMLLTNEDTQILACNRYFETISGHKLRDLLGQKTSIFNAKKLSESYYQQLWKQLNERGSWTGTILTRHTDSTVFPQDLTIQKLELGNNKTYFLGFSSDLSANLERINDVESGGVDLLTQLPNKDSFLMCLTKHCKKVAPRNGLLVLALQPKFPSDEDMEIKRQFASYLKDCKQVLCSGYLGEGCFVASLSFQTASSTHSIRDISRGVTDFFHSFKHAQLGVAQALRDGITGVSVLKADAKKPSQLVSHAYQAVLELHAGQSKRINFYDRQIHNQIERKKRIDAHVLDTLESGEIEVYFQPIVDIELHRIDKFEALCRFPVHPDFEASTQEMVNAVEDLDKVVELDDLVLLSALRQLPDIKERFGQHVKLSINRSLKTSLQLTDILERCALILDQKSIDPADITFEFTESAYFDDEEKNEQVLSLLREVGIKIAVDDFGTGCASFRYLKERYFDVLKIDRAFIQDITFESRQFYIVRSLVELANKLDLEVIAEGVETAQELKIMSSIGIRFIQGYYFSKPQPLVKLDHIDVSSITLACSTVSEETVGILAEHSHYIEPGDPLSLIYQHFQNTDSDYLPVVEKKTCVGFIDRNCMNLHLTPNMGTDLESSKEQSYWHKPANRIMTPVFTTIPSDAPIVCLRQHVADETPFPWCLNNERGEYQGFISERGVMYYLNNNLVS